MQFCLALLSAHDVRGKRREHASGGQKRRYLINGVLQLAEHERLREQIVDQGAGEDAEMLAHYRHRLAFFVVGLPHFAVGVLDV